MRSIAVLVVSVAVFLAAVPPVSAASAQRCGALTGRDLLPRNGAVKLVRAGDRYRLCARPRGVVRTVATVGDRGGRRTSLSLGITRGARVVVKIAGAGRDGSYDLTWTLVDARTGRKTPVWRFDSRVANALPEPSQMVLEPGGRFGLLFRSFDGPGAWPGLPGDVETLVAGYDRDGVRHDLDTGTRAEIAPRALRLAGSILVWNHGEDRRSQDLATLS